MSKRFAALAAVACALASASALALTPAASADSSLPTLNVTLQGSQGIVVSGSEVSGGVQIVATDTGGRGAYALIRLNPNESPDVAIAQAFSAVLSHHGDVNALTQTGNLVLVSAEAPSTVQTVLTAGYWAALNVSGQGQPGFTVFKVSQSPNPATLPSPTGSESAIEFGFRGSKRLHRGTLVRAVNGGWLVHMVDLMGVKNRADGLKALAGLRAGKGRKFFRPLSTGVFVSLLDPASPGAMQQQVLTARRGWYVEACFMNTSDGREHTQLGMERLIKIVK